MQYRGAIDKPARVEEVEREGEVVFVEMRYLVSAWYAKS
jgi:hypothetical protein